MLYLHHPQRWGSRPLSWVSGTQSSLAPAQCWGLCPEKARSVWWDSGEGTSSEAGTCLDPKGPTMRSPPSKTDCREDGEGTESSLVLNATTHSQARAVGLHYSWTPVLQTHLLTQIYVHPQTNTHSMSMVTHGPMHSGEKCESVPS